MLGYLWVIISAFLYGSLAVVSKYIYGQGIAPLTLLVINSSSTAIALWIFVLFTRYPAWKLNKGAAKHLLLQGAAGTFITSLGFFLALKYIDASIAILILFTHPLIVLGLEIIFDKKKLLLAHIIALVMCLTGLVIIVDPFPISQLKFNPFGFTLATVASFALAFNNWYGEKNILRSNPFAVMIWTFTTQGALFIAIHPGGILQAFALPPYALLLIIVAALATWLAPNFLILKGIEAIGASHASLVGSLEVVFTMLLAFLILQERISLWEAVGAGLIVAGIFFLPHGADEPLPPVNPL